MIASISIKNVRDLLLGTVIAVLLAAVVCKGFEYFYPRPVLPDRPYVNEVEVWQEQMQVFSTHFFYAALLFAVLFIIIALSVRMHFMANSFAAGGFLTFLAGLFCNWYHLSVLIQFFGLFILLSVLLMAGYNLHKER